ncbi:MAG: DUF2478 domain-containing protein [Paracoccaceae bacterium]|nr:MAG: DUF2478 domain-containing protein [Paracoccaceae bacterium]
MQIAFVTLEGRGLIDDCLSDAVARLQARGLRLAGTVRALPVSHHAHPCDTDIRVLPDGPLHRISQPLGQGSRGCRLDSGAIEAVAADVEARLAGCDVLVVNKFGKQECLGRGLRPAIVRALDLGVPVIVGVNGLNLPAFLEFVDGLATPLEARASRVVAWAEGAAARNLAMTEASD